ncbi:MAG: NTP transferase domain-containing protein [Candidatus Thermoplasmatota archaeon]|nr:NTP transferase domain-containing protein [Candidatus Thermoplasmatota archaeon]
MDMKAVILAAGKGRRLRPFTDDMPKVMLPIANRPIIASALAALAENNVRDIVIVAGYRQERIKDYVGNGGSFDVDVTYVEQKRQIGTGHALMQAADHLDEPFLVVPGDNLIDGDSIAALIDHDGEQAVLMEKSPSPSKYGVLSTRDGMVVDIHEKPDVPESNLVSTGVYKLQPSIRDRLAASLEDGHGSLTDGIRLAISHGEQIGAVAGSGAWMDVVYPWNVLEVNAHALQNIRGGQAGKRERNVVIKGSVQVGEDTVIHPGCYISGPAVIGEGCEIGPNVCIFPSTSIGDDVTVYPFTDIRYSVVMDGVRIGSHSFISHSVIGKNTRLSSHFSTMVGDAVIDVDGAFHRVADQGAYVGGGCRVGQQVVVSPGRIVGTGCRIGPRAVIDTDIPNESSVM